MTVPYYRSSLQQQLSDLFTDPLAIALAKEFGFNNLGNIITAQMIAIIKQALPNAILLPNIMRAYHYLSFEVIIPLASLGITSASYKAVEPSLTAEIKKIVYLINSSMVNLIIAINDGTLDPELAEEFDVNSLFIAPDFYAVGRNEPLAEPLAETGAYVSIGKTTSDSYPNVEWPVSMTDRGLKYPYLAIMFKLAYPLILDYSADVVHKFYKLCSSDDTETYTKLQEWVNFLDRCWSENGPSLNISPFNESRILLCKHIATIYADYGFDITRAGG